VASLERWAPLDAGCDAALALHDAGIAVRQTLFDSEIVISGTEKPRLGMRIVKYGAVSALACGLWSTRILRRMKSVSRVIPVPFG
jgi:hypothetical protein